MGRWGGGAGGREAGGGGMNIMGCVMVLTPHLLVIVMVLLFSMSVPVTAEPSQHCMIAIDCSEALRRNNENLQEKR